MAERRMFAKSIVLSDTFLDMPTSARCLYFTLGMFADDDGFVGSPKGIMRQCGATEDDMKILMAKKYVLSFASGIIVIKHWRVHNYIQKDRYKETTYLDEKSKLSLDSQGAYVTEGALDIIHESPVCIQSVSKADTQVSIGKESIGEESTGKVRKKPSPFKPPKISFAEFVSMTQEQYDKLCEEHGEDMVKELITILDDYKGSSGKKYKDDYRAIRSWVVDKWRDKHREKGQQGKSFKAQEHEDFMAFARDLAAKGEYVP